MCALHHSSLRDVLVSPRLSSGFPPPIPLSILLRWQQGWKNGHRGRRRKRRRRRDLTDLDGRLFPPSPSSSMGFSHNYQGGARPAGSLYDPGRFSLLLLLPLFENYASYSLAIEAGPRPHRKKGEEFTDKSSQGD